ncbi:MAG TPA: serine hydroxymethyltransferase [Devosia sp.]|nr:serine hydroxymethyltransferase [Devosia sp.]
MPAGRGSGNPSGRADVYFEFTQIGGQMRVAAIDSRTGTEVIVIAPVTASQIQMQNLALAKLKRRLEQGPAG